MKRIYVCGAYSAKDVMTVLNNMREGMRAATEVLLEGYAPFCPWMDHHYLFMLQDGEQLNVEDMYRYSMAWLEASDAVYVHPWSDWEMSKGVQEELKRARELGIPIFYSIDEINANFKGE